MNDLIINVRALDAGHGYMLGATGTVGGVSHQIEEHYSTESAMKARLATLWQWWANQVDAE